MKDFSLILQWLHFEILFPYLHSKCVAVLTELYPPGCPWQCWFHSTPTSRARELHCKKPEFSPDQCYLTRDTGVLLEKTYGAMKGCVLDHLFYPELSLQGRRVAGGYTAAQLEAAQHIWLAPRTCRKGYCCKSHGTHSGFCLGWPDAGSKGQKLGRHSIWPSCHLKGHDWVCVASRNTFFFPLWHHPRHRLSLLLTFR